MDSRHNMHALLIALKVTNLHRAVASGHPPLFLLSALVH